MLEREGLSLERQRLLRKTIGRRLNSHMAATIDFILTKPLVNAGMVARHLKITSKGAHALIAELELRELTGRSRYRAWTI